MSVQDEDDVHATVAPYASFDVFFGELFPQLVGSMSLYTGDADEAEDIAAEAMARVCRDWERVRTAGSPEAWVYRVALNLAHSWVRRRRVRRAKDHLVHSSSKETGPTPDAVAVRTALMALPARQRQAVVLRFFADCSVKETADAMRCAEGTVRALTAQGITALRRDVRGLEVEDDD